MRAAFAAAGVTGWLHARDVDTGAELAVDADTPVSTSSVHKLCLVVTLHRLAAEGRIDLAERIEVNPHDRTSGPTGLSAMADPVTISLRDLALLAITVSDNAAADALWARVGTPAINQAMADLGLTHTVAVHRVGELFATIAEDTGGAGPAALADPAVVARLRALDPHHTNRATARDMTRLLAAVWRDEACPPPYGDQVRRLLALQVWPHRLASGFPFDDVRVSGKTGSLPTLRHEVGVVEYPDGGRYAVAVFTRSASTAVNLPAADAAIGQTARLAVDALRVGSGAGVEG
nr:serine hydrolase [Allostreptomyces psammosilenae]